MDEVYLWEIENLADRFDSDGLGVRNRMHGTGFTALRPMSSSYGIEDGEGAPTFVVPASSSGDEEEEEEGGGGEKTEYNKLISVHECILADLVRRPNRTDPSSSSLKQVAKAYVRAGPRSRLHFDPDNVNAAIVTCGGLCPGLNNVVREITNSLHRLYGIGGRVYGIRGGYRGFYDPNYLPPP